MNEKRLRMYLDDHLGLLVAEIELIGRCRKSNRVTPDGELNTRRRFAVVGSPSHWSKSK